MGSSHPASAVVSPEFLALFRAHAAADGTMSFARFMELALYAPGLGYYRKARPRVGRSEGTDFFTASSSGPIFGELVAAACTSLLIAQGQTPADFTFVEIGAETEGGVLAGVAHPFAATRVLHLGETVALRGRCVVFSNELFDAQPFRRFLFRHGAWRELGVALQGDALREVELANGAPRSGEIALPSAATAPEGYIIDAPLAAAALAREIAVQSWTGLFVACDYGKTWRELATATPAGTARAYYRHTQSNDLLAQPGDQDLTCHICWDWLSEALEAQKFCAPTLESQEAFFIRHAEAALAAITTAEAARLSPRKLALMQLLHPGNLGQKFQVLHASRWGV